jgi:hypothetical protein
MCRPPELMDRRSHNLRQIHCRKTFLLLYSLKCIDKLSQLSISSWNSVFHRDTLPPYKFRVCSHERLFHLSSNFATFRGDFSAWLPIHLIARPAVTSSSAARLPVVYILLLVTCWPLLPSQKGKGERPHVLICRYMSDVGCKM